MGDKSGRYGDKGEKNYQIEGGGGSGYRMRTNYLF